MLSQKMTAMRAAIAASTLIVSIRYGPKRLAPGAAKRVPPHDCFKPKLTALHKVEFADDDFCIDQSTISGVGFYTL